MSHLAGLGTLGFIYETVARKAGFETRLSDTLRFAEAGKLMGLAAYGGPQDAWERWLRPVEGAPRVALSAYDIFLEMAALEKRYDDGQGKPYFRPWLVDLAYKVQHELEEALCHIVSEAMRETGLTRLCMAGGVALNSVANYTILKRCGLDDIFVFPAAADNGIAAGCALWAYAEVEGGEARPPIEVATLGRPATVDAIDQALAEHGDSLVVETLDTDAMVDAVAGALAQGSIVARYEGGCEYGPRALGHRSILADPTFARMKDVINARVKFREAFRPFAPIIPLERADEVFALGTRSPFMLLVADIRPEFHAVLPAITHADGTGRVQTCTASANPFFTALCSAASAKRGGPPVLLNTSFNVAGQPIVESPSEAIATFLRTDIDYLALEDRWIRRRDVPGEGLRRARGGPRRRVAAGRPPRRRRVRRAADGRAGRRALRWRDVGPLDGGRTRAALAHRRALQGDERALQEAAFVAPLQTDLGPSAVVLLDPLGVSTLADPSDRVAPLRLERADLELLLAALQPADLYRETVRVSLTLSHRELERATEELRVALHRFGVALHPSWAPAPRPEDTALPEASSVALEPFADEGFRVEGALGDFAAALREHGYEEAAIVALLDVPSLQQIEPTHWHWHAKYQLPDTPLADLVRLFLLRGVLPRERVDALLGASVADALGRVGALESLADGVRSRVDLYCSGGMVFATDHRAMLQEGDALSEDPVMYIGMDSHGLVQCAPREPCERLLDLCCGSGIQGLVASRYAREVVAVDLNPRAVRFSRFNAQLNGVQNHEVRFGSLYEPVAGERFDVVLANPPFVPSPDASLGFRDGGARGERLLRAIVEGAPAHLHLGGRVAIVTDLVDTETYPERLRAWWGEGGMDALILTTADRDEMLFSVPHCHAPFGQSIEAYNAELERWVENFRAAGLERVNFGYILLWTRSDGGADDVAMRTIHNPATPMHHEVEAWREQERRWRDPAAGQMYVCLHSDARLSCEHGPRGESPTHAVHIPDNDFFTRYTVPLRVYDALASLGRAPVRRAELGDPGPSWLRRLHRLGVVRLERVLPQAKDAPAVAASDEVVEQATKTTPTCLTSYLG